MKARTSHRAKPLAITTRGKTEAAPFKNAPCAFSISAVLNPAVGRYAKYRRLAAPLHEKAMAEAKRLCPRTITAGDPNDLTAEQLIKWRAERRAFESCFDDLSAQYGLPGIDADKEKAWKEVKRSFDQIVRLQSTTLVDLRIKIDLLETIPEMLGDDYVGLYPEKLVRSLRRDVAALVRA